MVDKEAGKQSGKAEGGGQKLEFRSQNSEWGGDLALDGAGAFVQLIGDALVSIFRTQLLFRAMPVLVGGAVGASALGP